MRTDFEGFITDVLRDDNEMLQNALDFAAYLRANEMLPGGEHGAIDYKDECLCYMHLDGLNEEPGPWTIWIEGGDYSSEHEDVPMNERMKEIAWAHVNFCVSCGCGSQPGMHKTIFRKEFDNVCNADMAFYKPDAETLECVKKLLEMRKNEISNLD